MAKQSEALKILDDINGFITGSVGGFFPKYFGKFDSVDVVQKAVGRSTIATPSNQMPHLP